MQASLGLGFASICDIISGTFNVRYCIQWLSHSTTTNYTECNRCTSIRGIHVRVQQGHSSCSSHLSLRLPSAGEPAPAAGGALLSLSAVRKILGSVRIMTPQDTRVAGTLTITSCRVWGGFATSARPGWALQSAIERPNRKWSWQAGS
jgi:hypothetical protein